MNPDDLLYPSDFLPPGTRLPKDFSILDVLEIPSPHLSAPRDGGVYLAIEGIDGSGKTTIAKMLAKEASKKGCKTGLVKEPYYPESKRLLEETLGKDPVLEAYIFAADRMLMHSRVLIPLLKERQLVIGDRSLIASLAYQVARGAPRELVASLNYHAIRPHRAYVLDLDPRIALERLRKREEKSLTFLETIQAKIRDEYLKIARKYPGRIVVVDASRPPEVIVKGILDDLAKWGALSCI